MALELFHFTGPDGKDYTLPKRIPSKNLRAVRRLDNLDAAYSLLEALADEETIAATDEMDSIEVIQMLRDWSQGASVGEF